MKLSYLNAILCFYSVEMCLEPKTIHNTPHVGIMYFATRVRSLLLFVGSFFMDDGILCSSFGLSLCARGLAHSRVYERSHNAALSRPPKGRWNVVFWLCSDFGREPAGYGAMAI